MTNIKEALERVTQIVNEKMHDLLPTEIQGKIGENRLLKL